MSDHRERPPKRRLHLTLDLHADTWSDLVDALRDIEFSIVHEDARSVTSGGSSTGWHFHLTDDPDMTHDAYIAALDAWQDRLTGAAEGPEDRCPECGWPNPSQNHAHIWGAAEGDTEVQR